MTQDPLKVSDKHFPRLRRETLYSLHKRVYPKSLDIPLLDVTLLGGQTGILWGGSCSGKSRLLIDIAGIMLCWCFYAFKSILYALDYE